MTRLLLPCVWIAWGLSYPLMSWSLEAVDLFSGRLIIMPTSGLILLAERPVKVDVGVVCLWLGRVSDRRFIARRLSADLIQRADKVMYEAKSERANHIHLVRAKLQDGVIVDCPDYDPAVEEDQA